MDIRQRFIDWYLDQFRGKVEDWHGGKLALYWLATILVSFIGVYLMYGLGSGRMETAELILGWIVFVAFLSLVGPLPATWVWLSVREEGNGPETE